MEHHNMVPDTNDPHRHDLNLYAVAHLAHTLPAAPPPTSYNHSWNERKQFATQRFHIVYALAKEALSIANHLDFARRIMETDLFDFTTLLHTPQLMPEPQTLAADIANLEYRFPTSTIRQQAREQLHLYDPPSGSGANSGVDITDHEFMRLFLTPTISELFIGAHRWPEDEARCTECGYYTESFRTGPIDDTEAEQQITDRIGPAIYWACRKCRHNFPATEGTVMQNVPLPPQEWLFLARTLLLARSDTPSDFPAHAGAFFSLATTPEQQQVTKQHIEYVIPSAAADSREAPIPHSTAFKILATAPATPRPTATS